MDDHPIRRSPAQVNGLWVDSGHWIALERPDAVVLAIQAALATAR